jgi:hypothetical protein
MLAAIRRAFGGEGELVVQRSNFFTASDRLRPGGQDICTAENRRRQDCVCGDWLDRHFDESRLRRFGCYIGRQDWIGITYRQ